MFKSLKAYL